MRLRFIILALVILTIGWEICVEAERTMGSENSQRMASRKHKTDTNSTRGLTNQIGWRYNVTNTNSSQSRTNNTRIGNRSHNSTSTNNNRNSTRVTSVNRNSNTQRNHGHTNSTKVTNPNRGTPNRNSTHINQTHFNNTRTTLPNRGSPTHNRNSTHINHGHSNSTRVYPTRTTPNQHPNTSGQQKKKKEPGFTESFLDSLQKELSKSRTTTVKPITKKKQQVNRHPPSTTRIPITTPPPPPYPYTPLVPFRNTSSPVRNQSPQVLYLPGGPFGYYVCNNSSHTYNGTTGSYIQPGIPASQQGSINSQTNPFYNPQNFRNGQPVTQQGIGQPGSIPQGFVNGQAGNTGFYVQPGLVAGQAGTYGSYVAQPQGFSQSGQGLPGSYVQTSQTPQGFSNGQPGSPMYSANYGFINATQGPGNVQAPVYTNPQYYGNSQVATNGSYVPNQQGYVQQALPVSYNPTGNYSSYFQAAAPTTYPQGFVPGHPGTPVAYNNPAPVAATQQGYVNGLPIVPVTQQPYIYGPNGQICTFVYNQPGVAGIPPGFVQQSYPANVSPGFPNIQPGSYGVYPTGTNNSFNTAGQYQSYPVWPNSAYPNVQHSAFNVSHG